MTVPSSVYTGLWVVVLLSVALWCLGRAVDRAPRSFEAARRRMHGEVQHDRSLAERWQQEAATSPLGLRLAAAVADDLALLELPANAFVSRIVATAIGVGFVGLGGVAALMAMGLLPVSPLWVVGVVLFACLTAAVCVRDVRTKAARRRVAMRHATNDLLQLVAVALTTSVSVEEAVRFALEFGDGDEHRLMRQAALSAPQRGVTVWDALLDIGERFDCRELKEFAVALERQGREGVSVSQTVTSMAAAMRSASLDELERDADRANANLSGPTVGFVIATVVFLAYPLAQRINDAFGG